MTPRTDTMARASSFMRRVLREPLVHFLLLGACLFAAWEFAGEARNATAPSKQIRLGVDELAQIALVFASQWRRDPTPEEFRQLIENRVQEEVLYREALAMGLDKDDTIVRRRMAQKLEFLAEDVAKAREPDRAELAAWFAMHTAEFAEPNRVSFRHLYFSPDRRGTRARADAADALGKLAGQPEESKLAAELADRFMFQDYYRDKTPNQLAREFGPRFALEVAKLAPGSWQGPFESGLGWHLVFVDTMIPGGVPAFEEVEPDVKTAWLNEQKALARQKAYADMRAKYTVLLPAPAGSASPGTKASATSSGAAPVAAPEKGDGSPPAKRPS